MSDLFSLPDELLIMILAYCSTSDLVQISRVCKKLNEITCERKLVRVINLNFYSVLCQVPVKSFLTYRPRAHHITTIDLTSCYWLTSSFIFNVMKRLENLENALVADTALLPNHLKQLLLSLPRVKRLSWTWQGGMSDPELRNVLNKIEFLYICVPKPQFSKDIVIFANKCVELRELWINHLDMFWYTKCPLNLEHLENIVLYPCTSVLIADSSSIIKQYWQSNPIRNFSNDQLKNVESMYAMHWSDVSRVMGLGSRNIKRISSPAPVDQSVVELLSIADCVQALNLVLPDGFPINELHLNRLPLEELCVRTTLNNQKCSELFCETVSACSKLRYLSLPVQALVCDIGVSDSKSMDCSKRRVSRVLHALPSDSKTPFNSMVVATPLVEVFEIGVSCKEHRPRMPSHLQWDFQSLSTIGNWGNLTSLSLAHLPINHGNFFTPMMRNCKNLKKLRILNLGPKASCIYTLDLYSALPYCKELEDFHWSQTHVGRTSKLWVAFQQISSLKRIALYLDGLSDVEDSHVYQTMEKCPSLFFLHVASCSTKSKSKQIKQTLISRWSKIRPHLAVWFGGPREAGESAERLPSVHAQEMLRQSSCLAELPVHGKGCLSFGQRDWAPHI